MCGLAGVYAGSTLSKAEIDAFQELMYVSALRGIDSTGIVKVVRKGNKGFSISSERDAVNPVSFLSRNSIQNFMREKSPLLLMGHCRWATIGEVNKQNAQPILEGKIFGAHNGTISHYTPKDTKQSTDSRELFKTIDKEGLVRALSKTSLGAYALTFIDTQARTLNFIRNPERELWLVRSKAQSLFWASELRFLYFMMSELGGYDRYEEPFLLKKNDLHSLELGCHVGALECTPLEDKINKEWSKQWSTVSTPYRSTVIVDSGLSPLYCKACCWNLKLCKCAPGTLKKFVRPDDNRISLDKRYFTPEPLKMSSVPTVVPHVVEKYIGFERRNIAMSMADSLLQIGCAGCRVVKEPADKVYWFSDKEYVCKDCKFNNQTVIADLKKVKAYGSGMFSERVG